MARSRALILAALAGAALLFGCAASPAPTPSPPRAPRLLIDESVASDFRSLAQSTWMQFLHAFRGRTDCFGDVHLHAALELDDRADYDPKTATVTVHVPATPAMLESALIHEWAHHVEFQCPAQAEIRSAFLHAQGLPAATPWRPANLLRGESESEWATIPSEQFAEGAIEVVLGRRQIPTTARVSPAAVQLIAEWAAGTWPSN